MPDASGDNTVASRLSALGLATQPGPEEFIGRWVPDQPAFAPTSHRRAEPAAAGAAALARRWPWLSTVVAPTTTAMLWLAGVCAVCVVVTGYALFHHRGVASPTPGPVPATTFAPLPSPTPSSVVVDVGGRVRRPGLVSLPLGARVADALRAAGGALRARDLLTVNLAAKVTDGQLLLIGVPGAAAAMPAAGSASTPGPVNLNSATAEQLDALPGIGPVLAQHILDWRTAHGGFRSVDQLRDVSGIGDSTFADLAPLVTV